MKRKKSDKTQVECSDKTFEPHKIRRFILALTFVVIVFFGWFLATSAKWVDSNFGNIGWGQAKAYLPGQQTLTHTPTGFITDFVWQALFTAACLTLLTAVVLTVFWIFFRSYPKKHFSRLMIALFMVAPLLIGGNAFASTIDFRGTMTDSSQMEFYYRVPNIIATPKDKMNLVVIYLESMDDAFGNADLIGENTLTSLQEATKDWQTIDRFSHYPTGGWTMPGIVSTQCGLPKYPTNSDTMYGRALCLGDVLHEAGYKNVWMGAASKEFEQKGIFLNSHNYDEILDRGYWEANGEEAPPEGYWGITDSRLFENAKSVISELEAGEQPYNLELLTVNNHVPVRQEDTCPNTSDNKTFSVLRCQSDTVADFINYMKETGVLDHTVVVVMADHSVHENDPKAMAYQAKLSADDQENIPLFFRVHSPEDFQFERSKENQLHMFPTVVELLGFTLENHRAGLGVSMLVPDTDPNVRGSIVGLSHEELTSVLRSRIPGDLRYPEETS